MCWSPSLLLALVDVLVPFLLVEVRLVSPAIGATVRVGFLRWWYAYCFFPCFWRFYVCAKSSKVLLDHTESMMEGRFTVAVLL